MALELLRPSEQNKLRGILPRQTLDQFEVALLTPLLQLPTAPSAGIQSNDRAGEIHSQPLQVRAAVRAFLFCQIEDVAMMSSRRTDNFQHQVLVSSCAL